MGLSDALRRLSGVSVATARPLSDRAGRPPRARASEGCKGKGHGGFQWGCRWQPEVGRGAGPRAWCDTEDTTPRGAVSSPDDQAAPCRELGHCRPGCRFPLNHTRHIGGHRRGMPLMDSSTHFRSARAAVRSASSLACSRRRDTDSESLGRKRRARKPHCIFAQGCNCSTSGVLTLSQHPRPCRLNSRRPLRPRFLARCANHRLFSLIQSSESGQGPSHPAASPPAANEEAHDVEGDR